MRRLDSVLDGVGGLGLGGEAPPVDGGGGDHAEQQGPAAVTTPAPARRQSGGRARKRHCTSLLFLELVDF